MVTVASQLGTQESNSLVARYAAICLEHVSVRRATTAEDWSQVGELRAAGFSRVGNGERTSARPIAWVDDGDHADGTFSLLGVDATGETLATLRVQDGRAGSVELSKFVPLEELLKPAERPYVQFARLTARKAPGSLDVMFGLFKAAWRWCLAEGLETIVIATPPWSRPIYDFMHFEERGPSGRFRHRLAGSAEHVTMTLPVQGAETLWRRRRQPLSGLFFDVDDPA